MATFGSSAPLPGSSALVADPQFQDVVQRSRSLTQKILLSIPDAHTSCIHTETLQLNNSSENAKLALMATAIGIRPAPVLLSESFVLETGLRIMSEGLQLHRALLSTIAPRLEHKDKVTGLMDDIRDLVIQVNKMLKMAQAEAVVQPSPTPVALHLPAQFEVQVAAHLTLVQLQAFSQDVDRCLKRLDQSNEDETDS